MSMSAKVLLLLVFAPLTLWASPEKSRPKVSLSGPQNCLEIVRYDTHYNSLYDSTIVPQSGFLTANVWWAPQRSFELTKVGNIKVIDKLSTAGVTPGAFNGYYAPPSRLFKALNDNGISDANIYFSSQGVNDPDSKPHIVVRGENLIEFVEDEGAEAIYYSHKPLEAEIAEGSHIYRLSGAVNHEGHDVELPLTRQGNILKWRNLTLTENGKGGYSTFDGAHTIEPYSADAVAYVYKQGVRMIYINKEVLQNRIRKGVGKTRFANTGKAGAWVSGTFDEPNILIQVKDGLLEVTKFGWGSRTVILKRVSENKFWGDNGAELDYLSAEVALLTLDSREEPMVIRKHHSIQSSGLFKQGRYKRVNHPTEVAAILTRNAEGTEITLKIHKIRSALPIVSGKIHFEKSDNGEYISKSRRYKLYDFGEDGFMIYDPDPNAAKSETSKYFIKEDQLYHD